MELAKASVSSVELLQLTKTDTVCAILRESIITGLLKPGEHIGQQQLAGVLNVSATPVREALRKLEAHGVLTYNPHRGARVAVADPATVDEVYRARALLEGLATEHAAFRIDPAALARLEDLSKAQMPSFLEQGLDSGDFTAFRRANYEFHKGLLMSSGLSVIPEVVDNLWARSVAPDGLYQFDIDRVRDALDEHLSILRAVRARDGATARLAMERHIDRTRATYLRYLGPQGGRGATGLDVPHDWRA